jgi:CBS domain-containing protein
MTIAVILSGKGHDVVSIDASQTVGEAVHLLAEQRIGAVPVLDGNVILGVFSERDVIGCLHHGGAGTLDRPVTSAMTAPVVTVSPEEPVLAALSLMTQRRIRHLPVVEGGRLIGIVSIGDLVKHRIELIEAEAQAMRAYISS